MGEKDEEKLLNEYQNRNKAFENLKVENREMANEAATMEELFTKIKQVTGTNALEDIVAKFIGQKANRTALEKEKNEAERRLANAKAQKEASYQEFLELKASGAGGSEMNRELQNRLEQELLQAKASFKVTKAAAERLEDVLSSIQQGMQGIITRLSPYKVYFLDFCCYANIRLCFYRIWSIHMKSLDYNVLEWPRLTTLQALSSS